MNNKITNRLTNYSLLDQLRQQQLSKLFCINLYLQLMEQDKQQSDINIEDIVCQAQTTNKIEELSIHTLNHFSMNFRQCYKSLEKQAIKIHDPMEIETFHANIVYLISKIQPSKGALANVLDEVKCIVASYYPQDSKIQLRNAAKSKNIFIIDKLTPNQEKQLFVDVGISIDHIMKCLMLRESQLAMVIYIEEQSKKYPKLQFMQVYEEYFKQIKGYVIPSENCFNPINYFLLSKILETQSSFYQQFGNKASLLEEQIIKCSKLLNQHQIIQSKSKLSIQKSIRLLKILSSKISTIADLFPFACIKSHEDLFSIDKRHPRWQRLFELDIIMYKLYGQSNAVHKSFDKLKANLNIINAAMSILNQNNQAEGLQNFRKRWESAGKVLQVALFKDNALHQAEVMISDPNQKLAKEIWNLPQRAEFKKFIELGLPSIEFSEKFYIPRITTQYFYSQLNQTKASLPDFKIESLGKYYKQLQFESQKKIPIRINNHFNLVLKNLNQDQPKQQSNFFRKTFTQISKNFKTGVENIKNKLNKTVYQIPKQVIFHIHGGGFISMSSFIHQAYTRKWANNLKVPIISVDYGKAPQHPYPQGLSDCFEAYMWMLNCMNQIYEFQPVKIILVGDSAGGNLVASLTNLLIKSNLRIPDGVVMVYPALNLNYYDYSPSLLTALNDLILPHTFLKICLKSYLQDPQFKPEKDYLVSPILTPKEILKKYPKTRMFVGSKDPFHDDCCRFAEKLSLIDPNRIHLTIFQQFPHGFLQFDMKNQPHYFCNQATKEVEEALKYLLIAKPIQF